MDGETAIITFNCINRGISLDLQIPLGISANDLVIALNTAFDLGINTEDFKNCFLKAERPIAFLRGNKNLSEFGIRNGTIINFTE